MTQDILTPIEAVDMMHHFEGSRRQPYYDPVRLATIGVGHLIKPGEAERFGCRAVNGRVEIVDPEFALTPDEVEQLFLSDLAIFERGLIPLVGYRRLHPLQFGALVSFCFNLGLGAFKSSTLRKVVLRQEDARAPEQFKRWVYAGGKKLDGLVRRRKAEADMFGRGAAKLV